MKLKKVHIILLVFVILTMFVFSSVYADDGDTGTGSEEEESPDVALIEDGYTFSPKLIIPGKWDDWKGWRTARLIEKGSLDYYEIIPVRNSGTTKINFDPEKVVYRIDGEKSEIVLDAKYFKLGDLPQDLDPNEEFNIEVWINKDLILKNDIPVDNYKGSINFWVEETKNYLSIPVDISFKSSIGYAILWILIGAFAYPVGKKVVEKLEILETRAKWDKIYRSAKLRGKRTFGLKWLEDYLLKLWKDYNQRNISISEKLNLIDTKFLSLLDYEVEKNLPDYIEKHPNTDTKAITAAYKKLEKTTKETAEADTAAVTQSIDAVFGRTKGKRGELRSTVKESFFARKAKEFKLWWGTVFLNLWMFLAWIFITGLLIFTGVSENYTNVDLWGSNPIKDWGDLFTWALSSNLVTTSAKDLIISKVLKKEAVEEGEG